MRARLAVGRRSAAVAGQFLPPERMKLATTSRQRRCLTDHFSRHAQRPPPPSAPYRPWLDRKLPHDVRVKRFAEVELGMLGRPAATFDAISLADQCSRLGDFVGMKLAHDVLDRVLAEKRHVDTEDRSTPFAIPVDLFQKVLFGWCFFANRGDVAQVRMRELMDLFLQTVRDEQERFGGDRFSSAMRLRPTTNLYNTFLQGLRDAAQSRPEAALLAKDVLDEMIQLHQKHGWHTKPNTRSYTLVVKALANSRIKKAGEHAEEMLRRIQQVHQKEKELYVSDYGVPYHTKDPHTNKRKIVTADQFVYCYVMQAYGCHPSMRGVMKARDLLIEAMSVTDGSVKLNAALFTGVIASFASVAENRKVSKEVRFSAAQLAEETLAMMKEDMDGLENDQELDMVAPYNACMNAYAKSDVPEAALKAETLLQKLLSDYTEGKSCVFPDTVSFNTVLNAWFRSAVWRKAAAQKAEELLELQMGLVNAGVLPACARPDGQSFSIVIGAYSRSKDPNKVQHAYRLYQGLMRGIAAGIVTPGRSVVVATTAVLAAACSKPKRTPEGDTGESEDRNAFESTTTPQSRINGDHEAYTIALQTYRELKDDIYQIGCEPDHMVFAKMLSVIGCHTEETSTERRQMVQVVFEDACAAGHVDKLVLKDLFQVCPDIKMVASLLQSEKLAGQHLYSVDQLPRLWTRNVPQQFRRIDRSEVLMAGDKSANKKCCIG